MVLEKLQIKSAMHYKKAASRIPPTSGQGICLAGRGPLPFHCFEGLCCPPALVAELETSAIVLTRSGNQSSEDNDEVERLIVVKASVRGANFTKLFRADVN